MMDLTTTYMGMKLRSPLVPSASPLSEDIHIYPVLLTAMTKT
jgi:hypothetical protein